MLGLTDLDFNLSSASWINLLNSLKAIFLICKAYLAKTADENKRTREMQNSESSFGTTNEDNKWKLLSLSVQIDCAPGLGCVNTHNQQLLPSTIMDVISQNRMTEKASCS